MLAAERRSRIQSAVRQQGAARVVDLAESLNVSEMTIRRDIDALAADGFVDKVHGGARLPNTSATTDDSFATHARRSIAEKHAIAKSAAALVAPGMSVGLAGGSTVWELARALRGVSDLSIVTNSLPIADVFARPNRVDEPYTQTVVLTGGVRTATDALVGPVAGRALEALHCDIVFLGVRGVDVQAGLTLSNLLEAETARSFIAAGREAVVLADSSKWRKVGLTTIADIHDIDRIVVDDGLDVEARETLSALTQLTIAPREIREG